MNNFAVALSFQFESIGSLCIALILAGTGGVAAHNSVSALFAEAATADTSLSLYVMSAAVISIAAKEALFRATLRVAEQEHSLVLAANAWHHRSDALSSIVALVGVAGTVAGVAEADAVAGIVIAALILRVSADLLYEAFKELTDTTLTAGERHAMVAVASAVPGVKAVRSLRARPVGGRVLVGLAAFAVLFFCLEKGENSSSSNTAHRLRLDC